MKKNKLVAMLRVKDGILFIERWLKRMETLVDEIVVVDNGSTDGTYEILQKHPKVVELKRTEGFHEGRDRIMLLEMAKKRNPDWLIGLDVDEIFEDALERKHLEKMMNSIIFKGFGFRRYHMWGDEEHYQSTWRDIMELSRHSRYLFKNTPKLFVRDTKIHCGVEGLIKPIAVSVFRIKHFADTNIEYRINAYKNYINVDPNRKEMYTQFMTQLNNSKHITRRFTENKMFNIKIWLEYFSLNILFMIFYLKRKVL